MTETHAPGVDTEARLTEAQARIRRNAKRWLADPEVRAKMAEQERAALARKEG